MKARIKHNQKVIAEDVLLATTLHTRLVGLMFGSSPPQNSKGLLLNPCNSIHTCFMRYALDIVFLSADNKVVKIIHNIRPWRMTWIYFKASKTLELPAGDLSKEVKEGDYLEVENV
ncbi:MAG TPA: DUF192 domain-containing protein [Bacteriovoracaceae bacterium]|nr:DUF192 domain-containing protein [Bacteriovoracaceae bacterium]